VRDSTHDLARTQLVRIDADGRAEVVECLFASQVTKKVIVPCQFVRASNLEPKGFFEQIFGAVFSALDRNGRYLPVSNIVV
jgi:hypothetical protein